MTIRPVGQITPGTQLYQNRYQIDRLIASTPLRAIYRATDHKQGRAALVIEMATPDTASAKRAIERAMPLVQLDHTILTTIQTLFVSDNSVFMTLSLAGGQTIEQIMAERKAPIPPVDAVRWVLKAAGGATFLARSIPGWYFGDLGPASMLITAENSVQLLGYELPLGLATPQAVAESAPNGTFAPEMRDGQADARADVYGLMATLHVLLTRRTWDPTVVHDEALAELRPDLPRALIDTIERGLAHNPMERFPDTGALFEALITALPEARSQSLPANWWLLHEITLDELEEEPPTLISARTRSLPTQDVETIPEDSPLTNPDEQPRNDEPEVLPNPAVVEVSPSADTSLAPSYDEMFSGLFDPAAMEVAALPTGWPHVVPQDIAVPLMQGDIGPVPDHIDTEPLLIDDQVITPLLDEVPSHEPILSGPVFIPTPEPAPWLFEPEPEPLAAHVEPESEPMPPPPIIEASPAHSAAWLAAHAEPEPIGNPPPPPEASPTTTVFEPTSLSLPPEQWIAAHSDAEPNAAPTPSAASPEEDAAFYTRASSRGLLGRLIERLQGQPAITAGLATIVIPRHMRPHQSYPILVRMQCQPLPAEVRAQHRKIQAIVEVETSLQAFTMPVRRLALPIPPDGGLVEGTLSVTPLRLSQRNAPDRLVFAFRQLDGRPLHQGLFIADVMIGTSDEDGSMLTLVHSIALPS